MEPIQPNTSSPPKAGNVGGVVNEQLTPEFRQVQAMRQLSMI